MGKRKDWKPTRHSVLCSAHFQEDCYPLKFRLGLLESSGKTIKKTLNENAVPTIYPTCLTATTPQPGKRGSFVDDVTTPKSSVKRPRSAFVKRDIQRMMREYDEAENESENINQEAEPDRESSTEVTVT
ncbi:uncharacterized protein LOC132563302 [Ylistrum balloti]|uniref:uncharacterized protein LOC132563302 n=1 Tax=Ylistrum balloti TaxID=509963 RepID=UPI002905EF7C|nr:uncharacterized protein LOC132563302 [Ylistrum balloti]